jgi:hypothetical protein
MWSVRAQHVNLAQSQRAPCGGVRSLAQTRGRAEHSASPNCLLRCGALSACSPGRNLQAKRGEVPTECSRNGEIKTSLTVQLGNGSGLVLGGLISLWLCKENNKLRDWKNVFALHIPPWASHTYDFVVLTSLTHPRKILLVVLQLGK